MGWVLQGIIGNQTNNLFRLNKCKIMQHNWIPVSGIDVKVIDPIEMKERNLNVVKVEYRNKEIVFGYLEYKYHNTDCIKAYAIFSAGNEKWVFDKIIFENSVYKLRGYSIWDYEWYSVSKHRPVVKHPYYKQTHKPEIVAIFVDNYSMIRFGYTEFSNGAYGIYLAK